MNTPILQLREKKKNIVLILATAVFLALAINFSTSYLSEILSNYPILLIVLGTVCLLMGIFLLKKIAFSDTEYIVRIRGAVAFGVGDEKINPIKIIGYSFNDDFCRYLCAFVHENKAYLRLLSNRDSNENSEDTFDPDDLNHNTIINSTVEFTILNQLQGHLNSYFVYNEIDRGRIITLTRDKIDAKVLRNRVIDQLTKDMKERSVFSRDPDSDSSGIIFYSQSSDGSIYQRLDIELPPRSNISRNKYGYLVIDNPVFNLTIMPRYEGFSTHLHRIFLPSEDGYFSPLLVSLKMQIRIKSMAFFTRD